MRSKNKTLKNPPKTPRPRRTAVGPSPAPAAPSPAEVLRSIADEANRKKAEEEAQRARAVADRVIAECRKAADKGLYEIRYTEGRLAPSVIEMLALDDLDVQDESFNTNDGTGGGRMFVYTISFKAT